MPFPADEAELASHAVTMVPVRHALLVWKGSCQ